MNYPIATSSLNTQFSLEPLRNIVNPAHGFVPVDGIDDVKIIELHYDWGDEIEIRRSSNLFATLIKKNQQHRTQYADIVYAKFAMHFTGELKPIIIGARSGQLAVIDDVDDMTGNVLHHLSQDAKAKLLLTLYTWFNVQKMVITAPPPNKGGSIKKIRCGFSVLGCFSNAASLPAQLSFSTSAFQSER